MEPIKIYPIVPSSRQRPLRALVKQTNTVKTIEDLSFQPTDKRYTDAQGQTWVLPYRAEFMPFINEKYFMYQTSAVKFQDAIIQSNLVPNANGQVPNANGLVPNANGLASAMPPFKYQEFVREYLRYGTPYRGLLLEHGLGSGKTRTAIMVAETFRAVGLPILILTPAFLATNFKTEIKKWTNLSDAEINAAYHFVSYNAGGRQGGQGSVLEQLAKLGIGFPDGDPRWANFTWLETHYHGLQPPQNWFIIIEEMHGLNRSFSNTQGKIRRELYHLLLAARDCKILGLSGTPMIEPYELGTIYNILRGPMGDGPNKHSAFPESAQEFNRKFITTDADGEECLINHDVFQKRICGLHSFFKGVSTDISGKIYPKAVYHDVVLDMADYQQAVYQKYAQPMAHRKRQKRGTTPADTDDPSSAAALPSTFLSTERKLCNFAFPADFYDPVVLEFCEAGTPRPATRLTLKNLVIRLKLVVTSETRETYAVALSAACYAAPPTGDLLAHLTSRDKDRLSEVHGSYKQATRAKLLRLVRQNPDVFRFIQPYSCKMYAIFQTLHDPAHGCAHIAPGLNAARQRMLNPEPPWLAPPPPDFIGDAAAEPSGAGTDDDISLEGEPVRLGPCDPPLPAAITDVYLTDTELARKYHGNYTVKGGPSMIYSFFSVLEGAGIFSKLLEAHGYELFQPRLNMDPATWVRKPRYAFIRGGMTGAQKEQLLHVFNHRANAHGQLLKIIFVTLAAVEGISLFHLRQIHIMEPYWDRNIIRQVTGRGFRLKSHFHLPEDECTINVYEYTARCQGIDTADVLIRDIADRKDRFQADFKALRMAAAVDCGINLNHHPGVKCFEFNTLDGFIYHADVSKDVQTIVRRVPVKMELVRTKTRTLVWNPEQFVNIRHFNPERQVYERVTSVHRVYDENNMTLPLLYVKMGVKNTATSESNNIFYRPRITVAGVTHVLEESN